MSYIKPHNTITDNELLRSPTENAVYDALALKQDSGNYITQLTGEVTASGPGSVAATISNNAVTNSKLAPVAYGTIKGRKTTGSGNVEDLTQADATALLNTFTDTLQGLVPASGGGTSNYLRADGTWATISIPASANPYLSNLLSPTAINQVLLGLDGSAAAPAYSFTSDPNTGIYRSGADTLNFATGGTNKFQVESAGSVKLMSASGADILWNTDGGGNIGMAVGGGRPDSVYVKTNLNLASLTASTILKADASNNIVSLANGSEGQVLKISGGVPTWATDATGMSNPMTTVGDIIVGGVAGAATRLGLGAVDKVLVSDGTTVTYQYAGLGGGNFSTASLILGRGKPTSSTGTKLTLLGTLAGDSLTTGNASVLIGDIGKSITTGLGNIFIGYEYIDGFPQSGYQPVATTTASIGIGISLRATGSDNVAIGYFATAVSDSVAIGSNVTAGTPGAYGGINHVAIGKNATIYAGDNCVALGYGAYSANNSQVVVGAGSSSGGNSATLGPKTGAVNNVVVGAGSGYFRNTGGNNTVLGSGSFNNASLTTAANNTVIGQGSGTSITTAASCTVVGQAACTAVTTATNLTAIGMNSCLQLTTGNENTVLGYYAGSTNSGSGITTGSQNVCIGARAAVANGTDNNATAVGFSCSAGISSVAVGQGSYSRGTGGVAIGVGAYTGTNNYNTVIGYSSLQGLGIGQNGGNQTTTLGAFTGGGSLGTGFGVNTRCLYLGIYAGSYSGGKTDEFMLDNQSRGSYANTQTKSLMYGVFNATETSQTLRINAQTRLSFGLQIAAKTGATKVTANTSINLYDHYIGVDTATPAAAVTVTLPAAATAGAGKLFIIKDEGGSALTYNIIIARSGSDKIEGSASDLTLANNREAAYLVSDGVDNWNRI